jgi:hypothetical protein
MGFQSGGLIMRLKKPDELTDKRILEIFGRDQYQYKDDSTLENATSSEFRGVGIARSSQAILVFGRDLPHSCSFEDEPLSETDRSLELLSRGGDILCFLINTVSDMYAWSIFSGGKRIRVHTVVQGKTLFSFGSETEYDKGLSGSQSGIIQLIEKFSGQTYLKLVFESGLQVKRYG